MNGKEKHCISNHTLEDNIEMDVINYVRGVDCRVLLRGFMNRKGKFIFLEISFSQMFDCYFPKGPAECRQ